MFVHVYSVVATMLGWLPVEFLLAADEAPAGKADPSPGLGAMLIPMAAFAFLWYFIIHKPQKRERQRRDDLLKQLKKNDRVVTIGGIIGVVVNVSSDDKEVTLRVDDNARIKMLRSSIQSVLGDPSEESDTKK